MTLGKRVICVSEFARVEVQETSIEVKIPLYVTNYCSQLIVRRRVGVGPPPDTMRQFLESVNRCQRLGIGLSSVVERLAWW